jgi:hypothetical protein
VTLNLLTLKLSFALYHLHRWPKSLTVVAGPGKMLTRAAFFLFPGHSRRRRQSLIRMMQQHMTYKQCCTAQLQRRCMAAA